MAREVTPEMVLQKVEALEGKIDTILAAIQKWEAKAEKVSGWL